MGIVKSLGWCGAILSAALLCNGAAMAQKKHAAIKNVSAYDAARESAIEGKVLQFSAASSKAPFGAHAMVQTSTGAVDVHIGNAKLLQANRFTLAAGDTVRVTGENVAFGSASVFVARVIEKGGQTLAVRSKTGMPLAAVARGTNGQIISPAGAR